MSDPAFAKCPCAQCGLHLEFPIEATGTQIDCPGCGQPTELVAAAVEEPAPPAALTIGEVVSAFSASVPRTRSSFFYQIGLLVVSVAMLALPLIYLAMIGLAVWGVYAWAIGFWPWLGSIRGGPRLYVFKLIAYLGPLFAGVVLVFFMIKPLFAKRAPRAQPLALNPAAEPLLFAFIQQLCRTVGAPRPARIDIDCQLNAAAGLRRGLWSLFSQDLVLTLGLPLVAGLSLRQFAGVMAHEFGHFTQGFGMRLSYLIRNVNVWFARVVFERDAWDVTLAEWAETQEWQLAIIVGLARLGVGFSRLLLHVLMLVGHGIGCFLLRQMEYDADTYEIRLAGSEAFEATVRRMHVLASLLGPAYKEMRASWNINHHLPESVPAFLLHHDANLSRAKRTQLEDTLGLEATGLLHTHPSNGDRIRRARQAGQPGVFQLEGPATALFSNFDVVAKQVTLLHYTDDLGLPQPLIKLMPVADSPTAISGSED